MMMVIIGTTPPWQNLDGDTLWGLLKGHCLGGKYEALSKGVNLGFFVFEISRLLGGQCTTVPQF